MSVQNAAMMVADNAGRKGIVEGIKKKTLKFQGRNPNSVASASLFMVSNLTENHKLTFKEIAAKSSVSDVTIKTAYKILYGFRHELVPKSWLDRTKSDLRDLPAFNTSSF